MSLRGSAGDLITSSSMRSPIFYDSANTAQFINPGGSTSRMLGLLKIGNSSTYNTDDGNWGTRLVVASTVHARIDVAQDADAMRSSWWAHTGGGGSVFGTVTGHDQFLYSHNAKRQTLFSGYSQEEASYRAPLFYDSNNTGYFLNPSASGGNALKTIGDWRQTTDGWSGEVGGKMQYHGNNWYIQAASSFIYRNSAGSNLFYVDNGGTGYVANILTAANSLRSPIFYDSNNTGYYGDFASTSNLNALQFNYTQHGSANNIRM